MFLYLSVLGSDNDDLAVYTINNSSTLTTIFKLHTNFNKDPY